MSTHTSRPRAEPIAILGGGVAGLAASTITRAPVFEAAAQVGGIVTTDRSDGFAFDRGIHVLQTKNPRILKLLDAFDVPMKAHHRQAYIYSHDTYTAYPFQVNTAGLPLALRARCVWDFLTREREAPLANYEDWMYANVGRGFADTFLIPYSEKFWTVHPREMTYEWTGNRVPHPSTLQVLRGAVWSKQTRVGTNADFRYPERGPGYGAIGEALARNAGPLHAGHRACRIDLRERVVHFENGAVVHFERLISTIPLPELVAICTDVPASVREAVARLRANSILVVNLGFAAPPRNNWHWVHFPESEVCFFRLSFPHNFASDMAPPGMSSVSAEVAYSQDHPPDRATIVARVIDDLIRVRLLRREDRLVCSVLTDIRHAYCIYDFPRKAALRTAREWLLSAGVVPAGRYGMWSYFWSDEAIMSGLHAGERALKASDGLDDAQGDLLAAG